jgi:hypothetical protein
MDVKRRLSLAPSAESRLLLAKRVSNLSELGAHPRPDGGHRGDNHDSDKARDKAIFDGCIPGGIFEEFTYANHVGISLAFARIKSTELIMFELRFEANMI